MYALVRTGGKQYRVAKDDTILVERIAADEGAEVISTTSSCWATATRSQSGPHG